MVRVTSPKPAGALPGRVRGLVKLATFENNGSVYLAAEAAVRVVGD
jgi:hypothetical protein